MKSCLPSIGFTSRVAGALGRQRAAGNSVPTASGVARVTYEQRPVLAQKMDRAARSEVDGCIELLEILEVDDCRDDTRECPVVVLEPARELLRLRDFRSE